MLSMALGLHRLEPSKVFWLRRGQAADNLAKRHPRLKDVVFVVFAQLRHEILLPRRELFDRRLERRPGVQAERGRARGDWSGRLSAMG